MAKTILLADDSVTIQKVVELTFMDQDYQVVATGDGTSALEQLPALGPDLVIADVHMPGADGYEVCRQTKDGHPEIPVLLLVGTFEQFDESKAAAVGADGHLKKPFDSQDLLSQVELLIASSAGAEPAAGAPPATAPSAEVAPAGADVFGTGAAQPSIGDLEPPSLDASPAGGTGSAQPFGVDPQTPEAADRDVWGAGAPDAGLPEVEAVPAAELEAPAFTAPPAADFMPEPEPEAPAFTAPPVADFAPEPEAELEAPAFATPPAADFAPEPEIADTAAVDLGAIEAAPESAAFDLVSPAAAEPADETPAAALLEAPSLEAPAIEDFAPIDEETTAEEPPEPWAPEPTAEPEPFLDAAHEAGEAVEAAAVEAVAEVAVAVEEVAAVEEATVETVEEAAAEAVEEAAAAEPAVETPAVAEPVAEAPATAEPAAAAANGSGPLSDDEVERIARRVAELMGEKALRDIAWEVLPDLAEVIIKERIRELESQVV